MPCVVCSRARALYYVRYGTIGLAEEDAIAKLGEDNVEVYHNKFSPLEWVIAGGKKTEKGYLKVLGGIIVCTHLAIPALTAGCDTVLSLCAT